MLYALGVLTGLVVATLIFAILAFFRAGIEKRVKIIETVLAQAGPKPKGAIFLPEDEADIARREHIEKQRAKGLDTPIEDLM